MFEYNSSYKLKSFIFTVCAFLCYLGFRFLFYTGYGRIIFVLAIILLIIYIVCKCLLLEFLLAKYGTSFTDKQFVINNLTLRNDYCTVIWTPGKQIVVMDNEYNVNNEKRMFRISKKDLDINKAWYRFCKTFEASSTLDGFALFYNIEMNVDIVVYDRKEAKTCSEDSENIKTNQINKSSAVVLPFPKVNIDDNSEDSSNLVNNDNSESQIMSDRIDVNNATADELAILPGINIVGAKKIVEYRDINGVFSDVDEFIKVSEVKQHFIPKIKEIIVLGQPKTVSANSDDETGRIVDF